MAYVFRCGGCWRFQYTDWTGKRRTATGTGGEKETRALAGRVEREHLEIRRGWRPAPTSALKHARRGFAEVRDEYLAWGNSQGGRGGRPWGKGHARMRRSLLAWWEERLELDLLGELDGILPRVEEALRELQAGGLTGKSVANRAESLRAFCAWCIGRRYLATDPLDGLAPFDTTPATRRRALSADEIHKLLAVAPEHRRLLYETAFTSGLRAGELRSLAVDDLDTDAGGLHLDAAWTKNRRDGFQPLPVPLVESLAAFAEGGEARRLYAKHYGRADAEPEGVPADPLLFVPTHTARMLDVDLRAAGIPKTAPGGQGRFPRLPGGLRQPCAGGGGRCEGSAELGPARHADDDHERLRAGRRGAPGRPDGGRGGGRPGRVTRPGMHRISSAESGRCRKSCAGNGLWKRGRGFDSRRLHH